MPSPEIILETLHRTEGLKHCPAQQIARLLPLIGYRQVPKGEVLFETGQPADDLYLAVAGECELKLQGREPDRVSQTTIGEEAAIGLPYYVSDCAITQDMELLIFPPAALKILQDHLPWKNGLQHTFSQRLSCTAPESQPSGQADTPTTSSAHELTGWLLCILIPILVYFGVGQISDLPDTRITALLTIFSISIVMWVFSLLPDFVPAILATLGILLTGIAPPDVVLQGFADDSFFMALSIFGLSAVIMASGLSYRILLWMLKSGPESKTWYNLSLFLTGQLLTPLIPTTNGRVAIVAPFLKELLRSFDATSKHLEAPRLSASLLSGVSLFSAVFLTSKSVNFVIFGLLPAQEQARFQWLYWLYAAAFCGAILFASYLLLSWLMFKNDCKPHISKAMINTQLQLLGPLSRGELACLASMALLVISFVTASSHHIPIPWVALTIMSGLLLSGLLSKEQFRARIDWGFLIFLGSLIGIVATMHHIGLDRYMALKLSWLGSYMNQNFELFIMILAALIFVTRLLLPINATVVLFAALLMPFAITSGINPWIIGFIILLLAESWIWPYQASYYQQFISIAGDAAQAQVPAVLRFNLALFIVKVIAIYLSLPFWHYLGIL